MGRIQPHLHPGRERRKVNLLAQITWKESNITYNLEVVSLSAHITWKESNITYKLEEVKLSAQITWEESNITYFLEGEGERSICQPRSYGKNSTSLTNWMVKRKGQFVSPDCMERIRHDLHTKRWRKGVIHQPSCMWWFYQILPLPTLLSGVSPQPTGCFLS